MSPPRQRIRLVLLDAFDTLITPRQPIHIQYAEEAQRAGLNVSPADVRKGFRSSFPDMNARYPLYGAKEAPPMTPKTWWTLLIKETMTFAGSPSEDVEKALGTLGPKLLQRFASDEGYRAFDEAHEALQAFKDMGVRTGVLSNADSRILDVLDSLKITPLLTAPPALNHLCGFSKPSAEIYHLACSQAETDPSRSLMIGDELIADYQGARLAGLQSLLIRRDGDFSDGATRSSSENLQSVDVIRGLDDAVKWVRRWNEECESP